MNRKLKVFVVDDHDMFRQGVRVLLGKSQKIEVIGEACNGKEFIDMLGSVDPDVVLMDISMPVMDGIEATRQAVKLQPEIRILTLSMFGDEEYYYKMIQSGVRGFIMKSAGIDELEHSIQQVANGSAYFSEDMLRIVKQNIHKSKSDNAGNLSEQETELIKSLALNLSDSEISRDMNISVESIQEIRTELLLKTGSVNTSGLVMYAIKNNMIEF